MYVCRVKSLNTYNTMKTVSYTLPSYWASYLINDDGSGMEDSEIERVDAFIEANNIGTCIACSEASWFQHGHDENRFEGSDVLEYTFIEL